MALLPRRRKSARLPGYDYSQPGAYFVTVCVRGSKCLFGDIAEGILRPNAAGKMVAKWWSKLESKYPLINIDPYFMVMPNHFRGIVFIEAPRGGHVGPPLQKIMQWFKTMTTNEYVHCFKESGWPAFQGSLWQRSFYDHSIRNEESLNRIREYIDNNPRRWELDKENPQAMGEDVFDGWLASFKTKPSFPNRRGGPTCPP